MRRHYAVAIVLIVLVAAIGVVRTEAHDATPTSAPTMLTLVERADRVTTVDLSEPGPSAGDMIIWGPDALYDAANVTDTGATSQGTCVTFGADGACLASETIVFSDGSTLEIQGIQAGGSAPSTRAIVGGSGTYVGATGTVALAPSADLKSFTKTIEIHL